MNRRGFLLGMLAAGAAPAIVKAANIMPVFARCESGLFAPTRLDALDGFNDYQRMLNYWYSQMTEVVALAQVKAR